MSDKEIIRKEIERRKSLLGDDRYLSDYEKGCRFGREDVFDELLAFIEDMPEEQKSECMIVPKPLECNSSCKECPYSTKSVSNKLEEAAEKYAYENWQSDDYHDGAADGMPFDAIGHTEKCFKAGAQWQKSQGIVEDAEIN